MSFAHTDDASQMLELAFSLDGFLSNWHHCDQMANYVGRCTSAGRADAFGYENLMSTITNELLETIFWRNAGVGSVSVQFCEQASDTRIDALIPVDEASHRFYRDILSRLESCDPAEFYQALLLAGGGEPGVLSLSELVANYGARLALGYDADSAKVRLSLSVSI